MATHRIDGPVLITGSSGFLGRRLAARLVGDGQAVTCLSRHPHHQDGARHMVGSVMELTDLEQAVRGVNAVVHLASVTAHEVIVTRPTEAMDVTVLGTRNVFEAVRRRAPNARVVFASTGKVYGGGEVPIVETRWPKPQNHLGRTKLIAEHLCQAYAGMGLGADVLRIFNVFGVGQSAQFLVPTVIHQLRGQLDVRSPRIQLGDTEVLRDFVFVDDVVSAVIAVLARADGEAFRVFNVCSGQGVSPRHIVDVMSELSGREIVIECDAMRMRADESDVEYGSYAKLQAAVGWQPEHTLREAMATILRSEIPEWSV